MNYHLIGFFKKIIIFIIAVSCLNNVLVGFILICLILGFNLILTVYARPYIKPLYNYLKIISDLTMFIFLILLCVIFTNY
jgi:hypothetical protein